MSVLTLPNPQTLTTSIRATAQVFEDPASAALLAQVSVVAPTDANVLVIGETGTGKELIARHLHALSARRAGPFVAVNCGAFSENLVESELFGHEKGAFTGAFAPKAGWFEEANGGTLFLDEIGDLPLGLQVKLLRVLQEREVIRLGSRKSIAIDVRIVAATNVRLESTVAAGHFREDLFYRLRVVHLALPALRDRLGDIIPLARHFISTYQRRLGYDETTLSPSAQQKLLTHSWPGNIRELENAIHHALIICRNNLIQPDDLQLSSLQSGRHEANAVTSASTASPSDVLSAALTGLFEENLDDLYERIEEVVVRSAFNYCHRNQVQTAKLLGLSRNIVRARLSKIGEIR